MISTKNSTIQELEGDAVYVGIIEDVSIYNNIAIYIVCEQDSAENGLEVSFSNITDFINSKTYNYTYYKNVNKVYHIPVSNRFLRLRYTNGSIAGKIDIRTVFNNINSICIGYNNTNQEYIPLTIDPSGRLLVSSDSSPSGGSATLEEQQVQSGYLEILKDTVADNKVNINLTDYATESTVNDISNKLSGTLNTYDASGIDELQNINTKLEGTLNTYDASGYDKLDEINNTLSGILNTYDASNNEELKELNFKINSDGNGNLYSNCRGQVLDVQPTYPEGSVQTISLSNKGEVYIKDLSGNQILNNLNTKLDNVLNVKDASGYEKLDEINNTLSGTLNTYDASGVQLLNNIDTKLSDLTVKPLAEVGIGTGLTGFDNIRITDEGAQIVAPRCQSVNFPDAISNTQEAPRSCTGSYIATPVFPYIYNGSTWDRLRGDINGLKLSNVLVTGGLGSNTTITAGNSSTTYSTSSISKMTLLYRDSNTGITDKIRVEVRPTFGSGVWFPLAEVQPNDTGTIRWYSLQIDPVGFGEIRVFNPSAVNYLNVYIQVGGYRF
jgi:hypothetical protein